MKSLPITALSTTVALFSVLFCYPLVGQMEVTSVDYFGLRQTKQATVEAAIEYTAGSPIELSIAEIKSRVSKLPGIEEVNVAPIQYPGNLALFIGIREKGQPSVEFRKAPQGTTKLAPELQKHYDEVMSQLMPAIRSGNAGEDRSAGHSISKYEPMAEKQKALIPIADRDFEQLVKVMRECPAARSRAAAAYIIAFATDKNRIVEHLQYACYDADAVVRNNAVRALAVLGAYAYENPETKIQIDPTPFLQLLGSVTWTDRNKGAAAVDSLTRTRDPELLRNLKENSLPELIEMANWKSSGHAFFCIRILARIAGWEEEKLIAKCRTLKEHEERTNWVKELVKQIDAND